MDKNNAKSKVAVVRCSTYDRTNVENTVGKAIELLGGFEVLLKAEGIQPNSKILLKPNLLAKAEPDKAVTTHPEVFRAVGKLLMEGGFRNLVYGDSPGHPVLTMEKTAEHCGIKEVADDLGIVPGNFEHGVNVEYKEGRSIKHFVLCKEVAGLIEQEEPPGAIINICKMKTHQLERITGAVKNTFGCVYGINKAATHAIYKTPEHFARMLADLNNLVKPKLHIMDGVVAMEGNGPGSGDPRSMHFILASADPVALDTVFCKLINLDPKIVATNVAAADLGIGTMNEDEIEIILGGMPMRKDGEVIPMDEFVFIFGEEDFNVQRSTEYKGGFRIMKLLEPFLGKKPVVLEGNCVACGVCVDACPVEGKAVELKVRKTANREKKVLATYNYSKCIKCFCCQEMCPKEAISVQKSLLTKIIDRQWKV